jgi:hypothetical protein
VTRWQLNIEDAKFEEVPVKVISEGFAVAPQLRAS